MVTNGVGLAAFAGPVGTPLRPSKSTLLASLGTLVGLVAASISFVALDWTAVVIIALKLAPERLSAGTCSVRVSGDLMGWSKVPLGCEDGFTHVMFL